MSVQDQSGSSVSNTTLSAGDGAALGAAQLKEHSPNLSCGNDFAPKARKPYTITKQRERWTEEEHKKFLEALKLYGRAWRQIEEHVGTKTAVQIRSHAQKFFSKVVRETSADNTNSVEPIEIPPPRPKRKPMHPYPRKLAHSNSLNKESLVSEQPVRPTSPNLSVSELENRSPTSVLSVVGSDAQGCSLDSNSRNGSQSPVSSAPDGASLSGSPIPEEQAPVKLELFPKEHKCEKESSAEEASCTRSLKLFGRTVLVTDSHMPSPTVEDSEEKLVQISSEKMDSLLHQEAQRTLCFMPSNPMKPASEAPLPWWSFCGGIPYPFLPHQSLNGSDGESEDKEIQKEGSWTGSNSGSGNDCENMDTESKEETEPTPSPKFGLSSRSAFSKPNLTSNKSILKGFVPYKRCLEEREMQSSTITCEDREAQRVRLCL